MAGITLPPQNAAQFTVRTVAQRLASAAKPDDATAKRLQEAREQAEQASKTLEHSKIDVKAERKKAAKQRLDVLTQALRMLKMVGGDPKMLAREGARLARELGKAVKEYTDAGGSGAAASVAAPAGEAKAAPKEGAKAGKTAEAAEGEGAEAAVSADGEAAEVEAAESGTAGTEAKGKAEGAPDAEADAEAQAAGKDGFAQQARVLAKKLKLFLNQQKERLKSEEGDGARRAEKDAKEALDELRKIEQVVRGLPGGNEGESPAEGLDILV